MIKHSYIKVGMILTAIMLATAFAISCGGSNTSAGSGSSAAALAGITIAGIAPDPVPQPISPAEWNDPDFMPGPDQTGTVYLNSEADLVDVAVVVQISNGAKAAYGLASGYEKPTSFGSASTVTISLGQALFVRVTAEDGKTVNYYRFSILLQSSNSQLSTLTVGGVSARLCTGAASWSSITAPGSVALSNAIKTDAVLEGIPAHSRATVEYAVVKSVGTTPNFTAIAAYTFTDGDVLYVRVSAENGLNFTYYRIAVQIGRDATLRSVVIGETEASSLGSPRTSWGAFTSAQRGSWQADDRMPAGGFEVIITPNDEEATVVWAAIATNVTAEPAYTGTSPHIFPPDQSDVVIKVTSQNGTNTNYYRMRLITKSWATVYKGTPTFVDPGDAGNEEYIDPLWDAEEWLDVSRFNTAETYEDWFATDGGRHTSARAKALWDDDGLWVYWDVDFFDYNDGTGDQTRTGSVSGQASSYNPGTDVTVSGNSTPDNAHTRDSVELFINERFQTYKAGNYGNQFRSGLPNADGTIWLSGEKGNAPSNMNPVTLFQIQRVVRSWIKKDGGGKETGYVIIMRAPWIYNTADTLDQADAVFGADGKVKDGAEIGMELQVNACATRTGQTSRDAILTWNGVTSQAYQQVRSFGIVMLKHNKP
jgi:hypothetical protein